jgi:hypothetical protein
LKTKHKIAVVTVSVILTAGISYWLLLQYTLRSMGREIMGREMPKLVKFVSDRVQAAAKPILEADVFASYNATTQTFLVHTRNAPGESSQLSGGQLSEFLRSHGLAAPKVLVMYREADFSDAAQRSDFEMALHSTLVAAGASSVTFAVEQTSNAKSLLEYHY